MRLVVVGAGISGLAAAHRAVERAREQGRPLELTVLEGADRVGGTIQTEQRDGFLVECGPDSFLSEKPWALALCQRIGLEERLMRTDDRFRRTFVVWGGRLHPLPEGFQLLAPTRLAPLLASGLFSWPGKLRMACDLVLPRGGDPDESLGAFVRRRLGREALERVAQPLVAGIYTADPDELSLSATMPRFAEMERRERSVILALWRAARKGPAQHAGTSGARWSLFVTLARGMDELVQALAARLPAGAVRLKERVTGVAREDGRWRIATASGVAYEADTLVLASEAHQAARMLRYVDPAVAHLLEGIPHASSATVSLAYRRADVRHPIDGFGFVVPHAERRPIIACTFSSVKYAGRAPDGHVLLRVFLGGALNEGVLQGDDATLVRTAREQIGPLLGVTAEPELARVARHARAMPQYHVGHAARAAAIEQAVSRHPGLRLVGGAYRGVGIADCVRSGEEAAERLLEETAGGSVG
ncbi:MAG TPA: protoporphyrinogen oxidase [Candidatus Dormibacteraeota bacterium]|nr:protoporphyrinogen oxidase [Candidatus Dormibacteraeota bacterium]